MAYALTVLDTVGRKIETARFQGDMCSLRLSQGTFSIWSRRRTLAMNGSAHAHDGDLNRVRKT